MRAHVQRVRFSPRKLLLHPVRSAARAAGILAALAACADDTRLPTAVHGTDRSPAAAVGPLRDNGIDRSDSHFSVRVVTTTEHASEGGDFSTASLKFVPPQTTTQVHIEAGYGTSGEARFGVWFDDRAEFPDIGSIRSVGNTVSIYDPHGSLREGLAFETFMAQLGLPGGTLNGAFFPSTPPGGDPCAYDPAACSPAAMGGALGARVTTEDVGDVRIVRTELEPTGFGTMSGTDHVSMAHRYRRVGNGNGNGNGKGNGNGGSGKAHDAEGSTTASREVWRLDEIVREHRGNGRVTRTKQQMHYSRWHRHGPRDAEREAAASAMRTAAATEIATAPVAASEAPTATILDRAAEDAPIPTLGSAGLLGSTICPRGTTEFDEMVGVRGARGNWLLFQHGFCASAATWSGMRLVAPSELNVVRQRAYSTTSYERIDTQVDELMQRLEPRPTQGHVVIGHSAGGIVGRRLGQRYPAQVQGVVTVGTPHLGSITAGIGGDAAGDLLVNIASSPCYVIILCELFAEVLTEHVGGTLLGGIINATAPAVNDLRPGSPFLTTLNNTPEPFARVSIDVAIPGRWAIARMLGDSRSPRERLADGYRPRGDARVTDVRNFYASVNWARYISAFLLWHVSHVSPGANCNRFGYDLTWPACTDPQTAQYWHQQWFQSILLLIVYEISGRIMWLMDFVDSAWHHVTKGGNLDSDGFIHTPSQRYPASPGSLPPLRLSVIGQYADSHAGQTASPQIVNLLREAVSQVGQRSIR